MLKSISLRSMVSILCIVFFANLVFAQDTTLLKKGFNVKILPILFYLPETSMAFGAAGVATFRTSAQQKRASVLQFVTDYTLKKQLTITTVFDIFLNEEDWRFIGELSYFSYQYNFYGLGINSRKDDFEKYQANYPRLRFASYKKISSKLKLGFLYQLEGIRKIDYKNEGIIDKNNYLGKEGGIVSNVGMGLLIDERDNTLSATKGYFAEVQLYRSSPILGAKYRYSKFSMDVRYYTTIKNKITLALNVYAADMLGEAPFYDMHSFGSASKSRGADDRRYRDNAIMVGQGELRFPIAGRFRGTVFGSLSTVNTSYDLVFRDRFIPAYGLGLRYTINKTDKSMVRIDVGRSEGEYTFYFTSNEAF